MATDTIVINNNMLNIHQMIIEMSAAHTPAMVGGSKAPINYSEPLNVFPSEKYVVTKFVGDNLSPHTTPQTTPSPSPKTTPHTTPHTTPRTTPHNGFKILT